VSARKSEFEHQLAGTQSRITAPGESHVAGALPKPPRYLSKDAKKKFRALTRQLAERRAVTAGDGHLIGIFCTQEERWLQALEKIRDEGAVRTYTRTGSDGLPVDVEKENLHIKLAQNCERQMVVILKQLGLTPKDRESVRPTAPVRPKNPPPHPESAEGLALEGDRLRRALAAEQAQAAAAPEPEPDIDLDPIHEEEIQ
jgi:P27 family predicted phage terminase small subunit